MIAFGVAGAYVTLAEPIAGADELTVSEARELAHRLLAAADRAELNEWSE